MTKQLYSEDPFAHNGYEIEIEDMEGEMKARIGWNKRDMEYGDVMIHADTAFLSWCSNNGYDSEVHTWFLVTVEGYPAYQDAP